MNSVEVPGSVMFWVFTDQVIEHPTILRAQFLELQAAGFNALMGFVRASRYGLEDPRVVEAVKYAGELCQAHDISFWFTLDPRWSARQLGQQLHSGLTVILCGEGIYAQQVPQIQPIRENRYNLRFLVRPRQTHICQDVAIHFWPRGLERVYAFPLNRPYYHPTEIIDLTDSSRFFFNARASYVEAFGNFTPPTAEPWAVMAFFKFDTNFFDFSNPTHLELYLKLVQHYASAGVMLDYLTWDEPGFYCLFGAYPFSPAIAAGFRSQTNQDLTSQIWKLVLNTQDGSHIFFRNQYFSQLQTIVQAAHQQTLTLARHLWSPAIQSGIHYTWHFETADMADMNHGSMDLWRSLECLDAGFTDLGGINDLRDPAAERYSHLAAMLIATQSLAKFSRQQQGFLNLWTVGEDDGTGYQNQIMNHGVNLLQLFSLRWLAHAYGPVGLIGSEASFLETDFCPGYPNHSTWRDFPKWNQRLLTTRQQHRGQFPTSNILVIFPVESLYAIGNPSVNPIARELFNLLLWLLDHHYAVDWLSASQLKSVSFNDHQFFYKDFNYQLIIYPYGTVIPTGITALLNQSAGQILYGYRWPQSDASGQPVTVPTPNYFANLTELSQLLERKPALILVEAPGATWVTVIQSLRQQVVALCPARVGGTLSGNVVFQGQKVELPAGAEFVQIIFGADFQPHILTAPAEIGSSAPRI
ncbi:hypothetical protein L0128_05670 [candidate division KSB1 bacterium]|nr:hypothetical protein [candidate division KSB1 bacterium]